MAESYQDELIILYAKKWQTADKLAVCFSRAHGKIPFLVFGGMAASSRSGRLVQPFACLSAELGSGKSVDRLRSCELLLPAPALSVEQLAYAALAAEVTDDLTEARDPREEIYERLAALLSQLTVRNPRLLTDAYLAQLLVAAGVGPLHTRCVICGRPLEGDQHFCTEQGGALCADCRDGFAVLPLSAGTRTLWTQLEQLDLANPQPFAVQGRDLMALERILHQFIVYHAEKPLKAMAFLRQLHK